MIILILNALRSEIRRDLKNRDDGIKKIASSFPLFKIVIEILYAFHAIDIRQMGAYCFG